MQRGVAIDTSFCPGYYRSSSPKKKLIAEKRKVAQDDFQRGHFLLFNFRPIFDILNVIIWTSSPTDNLFKIKFSSQEALNRAIYMDALKATN